MVKGEIEKATEGKAKSWEEKKGGDLEIANHVHCTLREISNIMKHLKHIIGFHVF